MNLEGLTVANSGVGLPGSGGTGVYIWIAKAMDVEGLDLPANPATPSAIPKIALSDLTISGLTKFEIREMSGAVRHEKIGELDGRSFKNTAEFELSGSSDVVLGFDAATANARLVIFMEEHTGGNIRVVGTRKSPARDHDSEGGGTGAKREDWKGSKFKFTSYAECPAPIVTGATYTSLDALVGSGSGS